MSNQICYFQGQRTITAVALPVNFETIIDNWVSLRTSMVRDKPAAFTRDEWAYLISFLQPALLREPFIDGFGTAVQFDGQRIDAFARPRGPISLWLPNNISLLGPLTLILLSLTGQPVRIKAGSSSDNLVDAFIGYALSHLREHPLGHYLASQVRCETFDRTDPRNTELAKSAKVRIVFGSDDAAAAIEALPHPVDSIGFSFVDRRSEAWIEPGQVTDETLIELLKVFAIYGQAGCTSPKRVILLDGNEQSSRDVQRRLVDLWPTLFHQQPEMHVASENVLAQQLAAANGWNATSTESFGSVIAVGDLTLDTCDSVTLMSLLPATLEEALATLPGNIQTIGYALDNPGDAAWRELLAKTAIKRFVPIKNMHHFGATWDGMNYWRQLFEDIEVAA